MAFSNIIILENAITKMLFNFTFALTLLSGLFVAAASGLVGSFLVLRRMTLMADSLSHVALPGIALGITLHFTPIWGGLLTLFLGVFLIWIVETKTKLATESVTGVIFVTALAIGALLIPEGDILEAFFGSIKDVTLIQLFLQTAVALGIIAFILRYLKQLALFSIAPDLSASITVSPVKMRLILLVLIALTVTIGISFAGVLLMSAILIIPAAASRNWASTFTQFILLSVILAIFALTFGLVSSQLTKLNPGLTTTLVSASLFAFSLLLKRR